MQLLRIKISEIKENIRQKEKKSKKADHIKQKLRISSWIVTKNIKV